MAEDGKIIDIDVEGLTSQIKTLENALVNFSKVSEVAVAGLQKQIDALDGAKFSELVKALKDSETAMRTTKKAVDERTMAEKQLAESQERLTKAESQRLAVEKQIKAEGMQMAASVKSEKESLEALNKVLEIYTNNSYEAASNVNRLKQEQEDLKKTQKDLKDSYKNGSISLEEYNGRLLDNTVELQQNKVALAEANLELKQATKEDEAVEDSMTKKSLTLGRLRDLYRDLTDEERANAEVGGVLLTSINRLDEELKGLDKSIGNNQRNVGNYEVGLKSLSKEGNTFSKVLTGVSRNALVAAGASNKFSSAILSMGQALRGIPGAGWILSIAAALVSVGTVLYKNLDLFKKNTEEIDKQRAISRSLLNINQEVRKETESSAKKLNIYLKELKDTEQGTKRWRDIVREIAKITGDDYETLVKYPDKINDITNKWIESYKTRITAEKTLQKIIDNNLSLNAARISNDTKEIETNLKKIGIPQSVIESYVKYRKEYTSYTELLSKNPIRNRAFVEFEKEVKSSGEKVNKQINDFIKEANENLESSINLGDLISEESFSKQNKEISKQEKKVQQLIFEWKVFKERIDDVVGAQDLLNNMSIRTNQINTELNNSIVKLYDDWKNGIISKEEFEEKSKEATLNSSKEVLENEINSLEEILAVTKLNIDERSKLELQLSEARKKLAETNVSDTKKSFQEIVKEIQEIGNVVADVFSQISEHISSTFDTQLSNIDKLSEKYSKYYDKRKAEVDAFYTDENATEEEIAQNQEMRTKMKAELDLEAMRQEEKLEKQRQEIAIRQAKFNKASAIANIGWSTAQAIMRAWAENPKLVAAALTVAIAAAGALQTAAVMATPLPTFEKGGIVGKENTVLWGEKRPEVAVEPSGKMFISSTPTIQTFQPGTEIFPSIQKYNETMEQSKRENELLNTYLLRKIADKETPYMNVTLDENGLVRVITKGGNRTTYHNKFSGIHS